MVQTVVEPVGLTDTEKVEFAALFKKAKSTDFKREIFHEMVKKTISVPIELMIVNQADEVFLVYRKDNEFDGYHHPGTVINDWETYETALKRLLAGEIVKDAGLEIAKPVMFAVTEGPRGDVPGGNPTRHAISLFHVARFHGKFSEKSGMGFFPLNALPENTLEFHRYYIENVLSPYLKTGRPIFFNQY